MFQTRQIEDVQQLTEVSKTGAVTVGAITNGNVAYVTAACTIGGATGPAATFTVGDELEVYPASGSNCGNLDIGAGPSTTPGTVSLYFQNNSGSTVTPTAGTTFTIVATRITPTLI